MSAIAGILFFNGAALEPGLIESLTAAMKNRGPDEQNHWAQGSVALGHCMLRTTPEAEEEHQPLASADGNLVLVWDGRLDNREVLRRELCAAGFSPRGNSDAELALQGYARWGEASPEHLLGDFAFAVWDARRQRLFCARDHMGARPFHYVCNGRFFAFASDDEALLGLPEVARGPNEELIAYLLAPSFDDFDLHRSWLGDVWTLPGATRIEVAANGSRAIMNYWQPQPGPESRFSSDSECQEAFLEVFGEAVRCRMRATGDIAALMSGGLDSAGIMAMATRLMRDMPGKRFHTYSAIFDQPETCIESRCIQSLTRGLGADAHFLSVPSMAGMASVKDLIDIAWARPHPIDNSILMPEMMFRAASRNGHRVVLHGASGDLTMAVPSRYPALYLQSGQLFRMLAECRSASRNNTYLKGISPMRLFLLNAWTGGVPEQVRVWVQRLRRRHAGSPLSGSVIHPDFAARTRLVERAAAGYRMPHAPEKGRERLQRFHIRTILPPHGISSGLTGMARVAGKHGVESRDPWGDRRVVEFFLRLPLEHRVRDGWTKYLVRTAFGDDIEPLVRWRSDKEHIGWNLTHRLMQESADFAGQVMEQHLGGIEQYVDSGAILKLYRAWRRGEADVDWERLYDTMVLAFWVRRVS